MRLHGGGTTTEGTVAFSSDFVRYVGYLGDPANCQIPDCDECKRERQRRVSDGGRLRNTESRLRATRAFRKLRKIAPREFDCLYLYCIGGNSIPRIAQLMTDRAVRLGKPERYDPAGVLLLMLSGIDKVTQYW